MLRLVWRQERPVSRYTLEVFVLTLSNVFEVYKCSLNFRIIELVPLKHAAAICHIILLPFEKKTHIFFIIVEV